jgi:hypothetical protein
MVATRTWSDKKTKGRKQPHIRSQPGFMWGGNGGLFSPPLKIYDHKTMF